MIGRNPKVSFGMAFQTEIRCTHTHAELGMSVCRYVCPLGWVSPRRSGRTVDDPAGPMRHPIRRVHLQKGIEA